MKKILTLISLLLIFALMCAFTSCDILLGKKITGDNSGNDSDASDELGVWEKATYLEDTELGEGAKTVQVEVKAEDRSVTFTIHTDADTLGEALMAHNLIEGEQGAYGLYIKTVNGIFADYSVDQTYWAFYKNGELMMTGVDGAEISDGEHYELIKQK